jgi:tRNA A58 N-methylase Trm61
MAISLKEKLSTLMKLDFRTIKMLLSQRHEGYLYDIGWFRSFSTMSSVDRNGSPIPWLSYPFIEFISGRLNKEMNIFEFGSGNSTFFYSDRVKHVTTIEHNKEWFEKISSEKTGNVELLYVPLDIDGKYCRSAANRNEKYDVIIVDAEDRVNCVFNSLGSLTDSGVMILDDSERDEYKEAIEFMKNNSYSRLDFWGIAPSVLLRKCTTVFYKRNNCLNI